MSQANQFYDNNNRPLVPPAERPFAEPAELDMSPETVWFNPTDKDCILDLYIGVTPCRSVRAKQQFRAMSPQQRKEFKTGLRRYIIRAGQRRSIHADFDQAIQQTHCMEQECTSRPMYCRDLTHHKMVTGGLGPQLVNERVQYRPVVHPSLIEVAALEEAARARAIEFLNQKQAAEASMAVAQAEAERARAMRDTAKAAEKAAQARAAEEQAKHVPAAVTSTAKKDK